MTHPGDVPQPQQPSVLAADGGNDAEAALDLTMGTVSATPVKDFSQFLR